MSTVRANKFQGLDAPNPAIELPADGTVILASGFGGNSLPVPSGSSSTPAVAPANDPNTGIYFPAGDSIGFVEGGVEVARISPQGRLGIGLTNPESPLHVETTGETILTVEGSGVPAAGAGGMLLLKNNDTTANNINQIQSADVGGQTTSAISFANVDQANNEGDLRFLTRPSAGSLTERFRFGSAGQFGIGGATFGTSGQVLTSQGASAAPSWADGGGITWLTTVSLLNQSAVTVTGIDTNAEHIIIAVINAFLNADANEGYRLRFGDGSLVTSNNYRYSVGSRSGSNFSSSDDKYLANQSSYTGANNTFEGHLWLSKVGTQWSISQMFGVRNATSGPNFGGGSFTGSEDIDRIQLATGTSTYGGGTLRVGYIL